MLKEVLDGLALQGVEILDRLQVRVQGQDFVCRHGQYLAVHATLVLHLQDAQRPTRHHHARRQRHRRQHEHVHRVAIAGDGLGHVPIIGRVVHRGVHEAIDEDRARGLIDFVLDRLAMHRDFDDDVEGVGDFVAWGNLIESHDKRRGR